MVQAAGAAARCAIHTDQAAIDTCSRCGNFVCVGCMEVHDFDTYCRDCAERVGVKGQQSGRATAALICGVLPLMTFCLPLAIPAVILGHMELEAIKRGEAPASGRNLAKGGVILGWINIGLMVIGILIGIGIAVS